MKTTTQIDKDLIVALDNFLKELDEKGYKIDRQTALRLAIQDFIAKHKKKPIVIDLQNDILLNYATKEN